MAHGQSPKMGGFGEPGERMTGSPGALPGGRDRSSFQSSPQGARRRSTSATCGTAEDFWISRRRHGALLLAQVRNAANIVIDNPLIDPFLLPNAQNQSAQQPSQGEDQKERQKETESVQVVPISANDALALAFPEKVQRLNLAAVFALFQQTEGVHFAKWEALSGGRFHRVLQDFVRCLPCPADKTIAQMAQALRLVERSHDTEGYLLGVHRKASGGVPFMPVEVWTHAAIFGFENSGRSCAIIWLQSLLNSKNVTVAVKPSGVLMEVNDGAGPGEQCSSPTNNSALRKRKSEEKVGNSVEIAIAAGGGSDVVTCTAWLKHCKAPAGSMVFQPGRAMKGATSTIVRECPDMDSPLSDASQFYQGTDLVSRTQSLAKQFELGYRYYFIAQDKQLLTSGTTAEVLAHMNSILEGVCERIAAAVGDVRVRQVHIVDAGGDILQTVLAARSPDRFDSDMFSGVDARAERDVWNLILGLCLGQRLQCPASLVIVSPGVDAQSTWVGDAPRGIMAPGKSESGKFRRSCSLDTKMSRSISFFDEILKETQRKGVSDDEDEEEEAKIPKSASNPVFGSNQDGGKEGTSANAPSFDFTPASRSQASSAPDENKDPGSPGIAQPKAQPQQFVSQDGPQVSGAHDPQPQTRQDPSSFASQDSAHDQAITPKTPKPGPKAEVKEKPKEAQQAPQAASEKASDQKKELPDTLEARLPPLVDAVNDLSKNTDEAIATAVDALEKIAELCNSKHRENRLPMVQGNFCVLNALKTALNWRPPQPRSEDVRLGALGVFRNIAVAEENSVKICREPGLLKALIVCGMEGDNPSAPLPEKLPPIKDKAISVLCHCSDVPANREFLIAENLAEIMRPLVALQDYKGQRALMTLAILTGREEAADGALSAHAEHIMRVVDLLDNVLNNPEFGKKYGWKLTHPLYPLRNLCISDKNKQLLATDRTVSLMLRVITDFLPQLSENVRAVELAVGVLLELSFYHEEDVNLQCQLFTDEVAAKLMPLLVEAKKLTTSSGDATIKSTIEIDATHLMNFLNRIRPPVKEEKVDRRPSMTMNTNVTEVDFSSLEPNQRPKHVMMSYSWSANKEHVIEMSRLLREQGFDVWRDEEGSKIVPPMGHGGVDEVMASAVENAACVVICVSRPYKESSNCRMEGQYANREKKHGNLDLIFLMMDDNYTTVSKKRVDGWLGIMIGDALWYPAWEPGQLQESCNRIAVNIRKSEHGDVSLNHEKSMGLLPQVAQPEEPPAPAPAAPPSEPATPATPAVRKTMIPAGNVQVIVPAAESHDAGPARASVMLAPSVKQLSQDSQPLSGNNSRKSFSKSTSMKRGGEEARRVTTRQSTVENSAGLTSPRAPVRSGTGRIGNASTGLGSALIGQNGQGSSSRLSVAAARSQGLKKSAALSAALPAAQGRNPAHSTSLINGDAGHKQDGTSQGSITNGGEDHAPVVETLHEWLTGRKLDTLGPALTRSKVDGRALLALRELAVEDMSRFMNFSHSQLRLKSGEALALYFELQRIQSVEELQFVIFDPGAIPPGCEAPSDASSTISDRILSSAPFDSNKQHRGQIGDKADCAIM